MQYCKLQIACMLIILYILFVCIKERKRYGQKYKLSKYNMLLYVGIISVFFDGLTAYTVNHQEQVSPVANMIFHLCFLLGLDYFIFRLFIYMLSLTAGYPKTKKGVWMIHSPLVINVLVVVASITKLEYRHGEITNYSMGMSAYTCFGMAVVYMLLSFYIFISRWRFIERNKRITILTYLLMQAALTIFQMLYPQSLLTSLGVTMIILGAYINQENPSMLELSHYHEEMIMGFATLVENKDGSTGGHIKRTTMYVKLLAEELRRRGYYREILTKDYVKNLCLAAPMHDIGKISIPDMILQKPGKLTDEEFERMKQHAENGGKIIKETFAHLGNEQYTDVAYRVARYHHEKWNGKGYPMGLAGEEIPLSARIMAVADVFDAISEKRCYREAMPMDKCFTIIKEGSGKDFDPVIAEVFLNCRDKVEEIHRNFSSEE